MKTIAILSIIFILTFPFVDLHSQNIENKIITVNIDYQNGQGFETVKLKDKSGITALEAIQLSAKVETKVIQGYVIVTSINDLKSEAGKTAWYYKVNGKNAPVLAINYELKDGDVVVWHFQEDVCTKTLKNQ